MGETCPQNLNSFSAGLLSVAIRGKVILKLSWINYGNKGMKVSIVGSLTMKGNYKCGMAEGKNLMEIEWIWKNWWIHGFENMDLYMHACMHVFMYANAYMCTYVYIYIYTYVYFCICVCNHIFITFVCWKALEAKIPW